MSLPDSDILTVKEVAKYLRLPVSTAYEMVRQGVIPAVKLGRQIRVPRKRLMKLLEQENTGGGAN